MTSSTQRFHNYSLFFTQLSLPVAMTRRVLLSLHSKHKTRNRPSKDIKRTKTRKPTTHRETSQYSSKETPLRADDIRTPRIHIHTVRFYGPNSVVFTPSPYPARMKEHNWPIHVFSFWFYPESGDMEFLLTWPWRMTGTPHHHPLSHMMT